MQHPDNSIVPLAKADLDFTDDSLWLISKAHRKCYCLSLQFLQIWRVCAVLFFTTRGPCGTELNSTMHAWTFFSKLGEWILSTFTKFDQFQNLLCFCISSSIYGSVLLSEVACNISFRSRSLFWEIYASNTKLPSFENQVLNYVFLDNCMKLWSTFTYGNWQVCS